MTTQDVLLAPAQLVDRIVQGDSSAEGELVERYSRALRAVLRRRLGNESDVEDFLQETLRLGVQKIRSGEVREPAKLGAFLTSLARYQVIEHFRRETRRRTDVDTEEVERAARVEPEPERHLLSAERSELIHRLLGELGTDRDRELLQRFYLAEEDKQAICEDLGLSDLHFNRVLHRARQRYKKLWQSQSGIPWGTSP